MKNRKESQNTPLRVVTEGCDNYYEQLEAVARVIRQKIAGIKNPCVTCMQVLNMVEMIQYGMTESVVASDVLDGCIKLDNSESDDEDEDQGLVLVNGSQAEEEADYYVVSLTAND